MQVCISMPWALAHAPKPLRLELWEGQTLVGHGMVLLMPRHMVCVAQELQQRVPWGAHTDGADFVSDLHSVRTAVWQALRAVPCIRSR